MMESVTMHSYSVKLPPPLPPKTKARTPPGSERSESDSEYYSVGSGSPGGVSHSSAPSVASITGSKPPSALASSSYAQNGTGCGSRQPSTVFLAGSESQPKSPPVQPAPRNGHVVTIRINPEANATQTNGYTTAHATISPTTQPSSINENKTYKSSSKVSLNQTNAINTIGKFIVNICESGEKSDNNYPENKTKINGTTKINIGDINIGEINSKIALDIKREMVQKQELITNGVATNGDMGNPYFFCNPFPCSQTNLMSSGQCSSSDTLDSGTCSDLDGSPPPLPKKKNSKSNGSSHKRVSVTVIGATSHNRASSVASSGAEVDSEDSESNISCDSLNSSELSTASIHEDSGGATFKSEILKASIISSEKRKSTTETIIPTQIPSAPAMPTFLNTPKSTGGFLPQGLLQDIRDRSAKLSTVPTIVQESTKTTWVEPDKKPVLIAMKKEPAVQQIEEKLTSFTLVSRVNSDSRKSKLMNVNTQPVIIDTIPAYPKSMPIVNESTYVDRKLEQEKQKQEKLYSGNFLYDTDKYYDFHLNENVFDEEVCDNDKKGQKKGVNVNGVCNGSDSEFFDEESMEYFAGYKDYKNKDAPAAIRSAKGTIRGVKNRVRAGIATFLQMQNTTAKSYKEKDAGKVVVYTTSMGIVRGTYQKCLQVKKILRTLLVKFEERDVFMSGEYQEEIKDRMRTTDVLVPQIFVDSQHIGDADTVERLNESGELRRMLKPYKSADACTTCQTCGGYRLLPCPVCSGSKKSVHRNHFTAEFVALKCMNCDEVGLVKCDAC